MTPITDLEIFQLLNLLVGKSFNRCELAESSLRIDNGDFRPISLRLTFFVISLCLYSPS